MTVMTRAKFLEKNENSNTERKFDAKFVLLRKIQFPLRKSRTPERIILVEGVKSSDPPRLGKKVQVCQIRSAEPCGLAGRAGDRGRTMEAKTSLHLSSIPIFIDDAIEPTLLIALIINRFYIAHQHAGEWVHNGRIWIWCRASRRTRDHGYCYP
jgi:hypothetical protein